MALTAEQEAQIARMVASGDIVRGCPSCEPFFENPNEFRPRHKPSDSCRSGKHPHCTCDFCF